MKLVELLARELKAWPDGAEFYCQDYNRAAYPYEMTPKRHEHREVLWGSDGQLSGVAAVVLSGIASDHDTAIVTRADWAAERARIAKPAKKADKGGWIRHRGGKCPVDASVKVDYRMRDGSIDDFGRKSETLDWAHYSEIGDIMAYKLHKPAEHVYDNADLKAAAYDAIQPIQWRDRITEIDATTQALTAERADLVQKLAGEGFVLIGRINELLTDAAQKHEDMSDWRNWKVGDIVECVSHNERWSAKFAIGSVNVIKEIITDSDVPDDLTINIGYYVSPFDFKWHSRPSA